jgi:hypothetical protein
VPPLHGQSLAQVLQFSPAPQTPLGHSVPVPPLGVGDGVGPVPTGGWVMVRSREVLPLPPLPSLTMTLIVSEVLVELSCV